MTGRRNGLPKKKRVHRLIWTAALMLMPGCVAAGPSQEPADRLGLDELRSAYLAAYNAGTVESMAEVYTADAVRMPYEAPVQNGRQAIIDFYRESFATRGFVPTLTFTTHAVEVLGQVSIERGSYREEIHPVGGGTALLEVGKYVVIARKGPAGRWRYDTTIFNRDGVPAPLP